VASRPGRASRDLFHASAEVLPALPGQGHVDIRDRRRGLLEGVEEDEEAPGPLVQNPEELAAVVAPQLAQLPGDLATVGEGKRGVGIAQGVEAIHLEEDSCSDGPWEIGEEVADWLAAIWGAIVDRLHRWHQSGQEPALGFTATPPIRIAAVSACSE